MLTFRDVVIIAAVVALVLLWFRRPRAACACPGGKKEPRPAPVQPKPRTCGILPCGGK